MFCPLRARTKLVQSSAFCCALFGSVSLDNDAAGQATRTVTPSDAPTANAQSPRVPLTRSATGASIGAGSVLRPSGFLTYDAFPFSPLFGYPAVNLGFPQPLGHQIISYGANGYIYRPVTDLGAYYDRAAAALKAGNYSQVLIELDPVLKEMPEDGDTWMLQAQALFALGTYGKAATALHTALRLLPQSSWGRPVMKAGEYFSSEAEFTARLRALEAYVRTHPREGAGHFLLGYYYGYRGHPSQAVAELRTALQLVTGDDELANALLAPLGSAPAADDAGEKPRPALDEGDGPREF
ncbi:MAG TPA: hypothetical protein VHD36_08295 [Pirellulales bacterium]|nr:hypothetical protein [Pirellulales bacterium]